MLVSVAHNHVFERRFFVVARHDVLFGRVDDSRLAVFFILLADRQKFGLDKFHLHFLACDDRFETRDLATHVGKLLFELVNFEVREPRKAHIEYSLRLYIAQFEPVAQRLLCRSRVLALLDYLDHFVDIAHGNDETFQDMLALFRRV